VSRKRKNNVDFGIPDCEIDSLARALLPTIQELFEDEEIKKEFEIWKVEKDTKVKNLKNPIHNPI
jgi:hypothetical protein